MTGPVHIAALSPTICSTWRSLTSRRPTGGTRSCCPGSGCSAHRFVEPFVVKWYLRGGIARSEEIPGAAIPGAPFLGVIGVAPSIERLRKFAAREQRLLDTGVLVMPPDPSGAVPATGPAAIEGLRTVPPRENGGNMDVKQLMAGTTVTFGDVVWHPRLPVFEFTHSAGERCICDHWHLRRRSRIDEGVALVAVVGDLNGIPGSAPLARCSTRPTSQLSQSTRDTRPTVVPASTRRAATRSTTCCCRRPRSTG